MDASTESLRVLHVDDQPDFAEMAATFVEREDPRFDIETATSAETAIDRLANGNFDCVVSDYEMPGRNGLEFLEDVREDHPDLPFILFTGKGSEEVASEAISAGVTDYLQKERGTEQYKLLAKRIVNAVEHHRVETSYREIFEKVPDGVVIHDPEDGSFVDMNSRYAEMFGYDREEMLDAGFEAIHPEEDGYTLANARQFVEEAAEREPQTFEWRNETKDGGQFWAEVHLTPTQLHGTKRILAVVRDISARKERERRFEAVFNNTHTFIGLLEPDGTVIEANDTVLSVGGVDRSEVVGQPLWESYWIESNPDARATVREGIEKARSGDFFRSEIQARGPDRDVTIDFSIRPITDDQGDVALLVPEGREITARKEQAHKRQQIIDRVTDAIVEVDADWTFRLVNEQAEALYGMTEPELLGADFWTVFSDALGTRFEEVYREVMETREPDSFVEYFSGLDGWFDVQVYPADDGGLAFYFQEVTDRIERTRELEQTRGLLDQTERIADVGGWEIDTETGDVFWTDHVFEILGRDDDSEPPLEEALDVYVDADRPLVERAIEDARAAGEPFDVDARFERPDGEIRWLKIQGEPVLEDGEVVTLRGAIQDITDRKQREQKLERTEAQFRGLAENFPNGGVHYFDDDLRYQYVAGGSFDEISTSPANLMGKAPREIDAYSTKIVETLESLMEASLDGEERVTEVDFEGHAFELRSVPIYGSESDVGGGFFISQDVTERRRREAALERQNERLERFARVVSHDLRNPLNVAQGQLEVATEELKQEGCENDRLDRVADALDRSQHLIDDLLTLERNGQQVDDVTTVALGALAESCWQNVETGTARLAVQTDLSVRADRQRLQQLLENLYRNAVEHNEGDVTVTVGALDGGFYVADDGIGISDERSEEVFEVGYSTAEEGTGFGLNIVHEIADAHGWTVEISESRDGGAQIEITGVE